MRFAAESATAAVLAALAEFGVGALPSPADAALRCPPHARARYPSVPAPCPRPSVGATRSLRVAAVCSYSPNYSFLGVLLLVGYPYPLQSGDSYVFGLSALRLANDNFFARERESFF